MKLFTIGFTGKRAETFFCLLRDAGVARVIDIRLNTAGQLAGFAKGRDLPFFLRELCGIDYLAWPEFAPPKALLNAYRKGLATWPDYERAYLGALQFRRAAEQVQTPLLDRACLLCSEPEPTHCHRRLAAEHLASRHGGIEVSHL